MKTNLDCYLLTGTSIRNGSLGMLGLLHQEPMLEFFVGRW